MRSGRGGFTVVELLLAAALGAMVVAGGISQLSSFTTAQARLVARTQLRQEAQNLQERLAQRVRMAIWAMSMPRGGMVMASVTDVDRCGYMCGLDRLELTWWRVDRDPRRPDRSGLVEQALDFPAFSGEARAAEVEALFAELRPPLRFMSERVKSFDIQAESNGLFRTRLAVSTPSPRGPGEIEFNLTEVIAARSRPIVDHLGDFEEVLASWKKAQRRRGRG